MCRRRLLPFLLLPTLALSLPASVHAESFKKRKDDFSLTVSPARLVIPAGQKHIVRYFEVTNTGRKRLQLVVVLSEFTQAEDGRVLFVPHGPYSAASWVRAFPSAFALPAGSSRRVRIEVVVPAHADPGDHQVGVLFKVPATPQPGKVALSGAIGTTVYVGVPGKRITKIVAGALHAPWWSDGGPVPLKLTVRNEGNVHSDFTDKKRLVVHLPHGKAVRFPEFSIGRDSTRVVEVAWTDPPLICLCHVHVNVPDGQGHMVRIEARVIMFPLRLVLGILLASLGLAVIFRTLRRNRRRHLEAQLELARREAYEQARRDLEDAGKR